MEPYSGREAANNAQLECCDPPICSTTSSQIAMSTDANANTTSSCGVSNHDFAVKSFLIYLLSNDNILQCLLSYLDLFDHIHICRANTSARAYVRRLATLQHININDLRTDCVEQMVTTWPNTSKINVGSGAVRDDNDLCRVIEGAVGQVYITMVSLDIHVTPCHINLAHCLFYFLYAHAPIHRMCSDASSSSAAAGVIFAKTV
jgi:hypothetical protein